MATKRQVPKELVKKRNDVLAEIKKAIEIKPQAPAENIIKDFTVDKPIDEIETPAAAETETPAPEAITETVSEATTETVSEVVEKRAPTSSLFDTFTQATEEDSKEETVSTRLEHIAESISDEDLKDDDYDLDAESPLMRKQTADVEATMIVEVAETLLAVGCMAIAKDWEAFGSNKYVIGKEKKKALKVAIMRMILLKSKKRNPTWSIIALALGAAIPMFAMAFLTRKAKTEREKSNEKLIAEQRALILQQNEFAAQQFIRDTEANNEALRTNLNNITDPQPIKIVKPLVIVKEKPASDGKERRGRHKLSCASYKGKKCNCKN